MFFKFLFLLGLLISFNLNAENLEIKDPDEFGVSQLILIIYLIYLSRMNLLNQLYSLKMAILLVKGMRMVSIKIHMVLLGQWQRVITQL